MKAGSIGKRCFSLVHLEKWFVFFCVQQKVLKLKIIFEEISKAICYKCHNVDKYFIGGVSPTTPLIHELMTCRVIIVDY